MAPKTGPKAILSTESLRREFAFNTFSWSDPETTQILDVSHWAPPSLGITVDPQGLKLVVHGAVGRTYALESTVALPAVGAWNVETNIVMTTNPLTFSNIGSSATENRFFRLRVTTP